MQQRQSRSLYGSSLRGVAALPLGYCCRWCATRDCASLARDYSRPLSLRRDGSWGDEEGTLPWCGRVGGAAGVCHGSRGRGGRRLLRVLEGKERTAVLGVTAASIVLLLAAIRSAP